MKTILRKLAIALLMLLVTPLSLHAKTPVVGEPAPDFTLTLMDGSKVSLSDLHGRVVVLNFWATWCGPCRNELPLLDAYYAMQKGTALPSMRWRVRTRLRCRCIA